MTAPAPTARIEPTGFPLQKGFRTKISFASDPNVTFWEKTVTPPGMEGGDKVDTSNQFNATFRTAAPQGLIELTDSGTKVAYDPSVMDEIQALINVRDTVTISYPDNDTYAFFGYLKSFIPDEMTEDTQPEATVEIVSTNWDPVAETEEGPVYGT